MSARAQSLECLLLEWMGGNFDFYTEFWIPTHSPDGEIKNQTRGKLPHQVHEAL